MVGQSGGREAARAGRPMGPKENIQSIGAERQERLVPLTARKRTGFGLTSLEEARCFAVKSRLLPGTTRAETSTSAKTFTSTDTVRTLSLHRLESTIHGARLYTHHRAAIRDGSDAIITLQLDLFFLLASSVYIPILWSYTSRASNFYYYKRNYKANGS